MCILNNSWNKHLSPLSSTLCLECPDYFFASQKTINKKNKVVLESPGFAPVEPLEDFVWRKTEPLKLRPFKPKYHLTMGELLLWKSMALHTSN